MASRTYYVGLKTGIKVLENADSGGTSWFTLPYSVSFNQTPLDVLDVKTDPSDAYKVFIAGVTTASFKGLAVSTDGGINWITPGGTWGGAISIGTTITKLSVVNSNLIYACTDKGKVLKSSNGGTVFNMLPSLPGSLGSVSITALCFSTKGRGVIGVLDSVGQSYLLETADDGVNWYILNNGLAMDISTGEEIGVINSIYFNPDQQVIVACGSKRIFKSTLSPYTSFTKVFTWPGDNGKHMTWFQNDPVSPTIRKFWAVGSGDHIISSADLFNNITTVRAYFTPPAVCNNSTSNRLNYTGAHFWDEFSGFYSVSSCRYGVTYSATPSIFAEPGDVEMTQEHTQNNAVWTQRIAPTCYSLVDCLTGTTYISNSNLASSVGKVVKFSTQGSQNPNCFTVSQLPSSGNYQGAIQVTVTNTFTSCVICTSNCFNLVNCDPDKSDDIIVIPITVSYFNDKIDKYVKLQGCDDCYRVVLTTNCVIPANQQGVNYVNQIEDIYDTCQLCQGTQVPGPFVLHQRRVKPGFYTPGCPPEYTVKTSCMYAEQAYDEMVAIRYGITICCDHDIDKWDIKKQLLELNAIYDPALCTPSVIECLPPCNPEAYVTAPIYIVPPCQEPEDVTGILTVLDPCPAPVPASVTPTIGFGTPPSAKCYYAYVFASVSATPTMTAITVNGVNINLTGSVTVPMTNAAFQFQFINAMSAEGYYVSGVTVTGSNTLGFNILISNFAGGTPQSFVHNGNGAPSTVALFNQPC